MHNELPNINDLPYSKLKKDLPQVKEAGDKIYSNSDLTQKREKKKKRKKDEVVIEKKKNKNELNYTKNPALKNVFLKHQQKKND